MSGKTKIDWATATWNVTAGCTKVSEGCRHCYAERMAYRLAHSPHVLTRDVHQRLVGGLGTWTGDVCIFRDKLSEPLHWKRSRRVFVNSMSDLFHEKVPFEFVTAVFGVMAACPQHQFLVLTKRSERMREFFLRLGDKPSERCVWAAERAIGRAVSPVHYPWFLSNVWLGVSVEDQATADERIPELLAAPAAHRFVSYEPALNVVDFSQCLNLAWTYSAGEWSPDSGDDFHPSADKRGGWWSKLDPPRIDWVILGCESGPGARPMDLDWARSVRDQCAAARVPFFFKQMMTNGKLVKMPKLDGRVHDAIPEELEV